MGCKEPDPPDTRRSPPVSMSEGKPQAYVPRPAGQLSFNKHIAPLVFHNCATCHRPGGAGPFDLLSYSDVRRHGKTIVSVTQSRYMPPWQPEPGYGEFIGERRLSVDQIGMLEQWVAEGAAEGDPADLPGVPQWPDGWFLGEPDLVVTMPRPYTLGGRGSGRIPDVRDPGSSQVETLRTSFGTAPAQPAGRASCCRAGGSDIPVPASG